MDPFMSIPSPLLLMIAKLIPDLPSLYHFDRASPVMYSLFNECGSEIMEAVLFTSIAPQISKIVRAIISIRSGHLSPQSYDDFLQTFIFSDVCAMPLQKDIQPSVLRQVLACSCRVHCLAKTSLQTMIRRCMALTPSRLTEPYTFNSRRRRPPPIGERFEIQPGASFPLSWVEEQRANRALWRIRLYFDLRDAARASLIRWTSVELLQLESIKVDIFWSRALSGKIFAVEIEHITTMAELFQEDMLRSADFPCTLNNPARRPRDDKQNVEWWQTTKHLDLPAPGYHFFSTAGKRRPGSPLAHSEFSFFRPFGFAFWDLQRMSALGLCRSSENKASQDDLLFRWHSILKNEVVRRTSANNILLP